MDWFEQMKACYDKKNKIFFARDNEMIVSLNDLLSRQTHRALVLWSFEFAEETVEKLQKRYPEETRLQEAVTTSKAWAAGSIKMPVAKKAILGAHAVAKEIQSPEDIALCHAVGQACSVVHTKGHAVGYPVYDLTAMVWQYGIEDCREKIEARTRQYSERLEYWKQNYDDSQYTWADFMRTD